MMLAAYDVLAPPADIDVAALPPGPIEDVRAHADVREPLAT